MKAECYVQIKPTWSRARADYGALKNVSVVNLMQRPPRIVHDGAAVVRLVFDVADDLFTPERQYPTATIQVDKTVADLTPALVTAMVKAKF